MKNYLIAFLLFIQMNLTYSQQGGEFLRFEFSNSMFPHILRNDGHIYRDSHFPKDLHYSDSTTLCYVPKNFKPKKKINLVVYFHGWYNNVDSSNKQFKLSEQFEKSGVDAILVMPEGPKNAPDSFGGKLEEKNVFKNFCDELIGKLSAPFNHKFEIDKIILAGHSGAYRVISFILLHGGLNDNIHSVILFDGLYGQTEKYSYWLDHYRGNFINIFTPDGGTKGESENLMKCLSAWNIDYSFVDENSLTPEILSKNRIVFIASQLGHNEVIATKNQFEQFLKTSISK